MPLWWGSAIMSLFYSITHWHSKLFFFLSDRPAFDSFSCAAFSLDCVFNSSYLFDILLYFIFCNSLHFTCKTCWCAASRPVYVCNYPYPACICQHAHSQPASCDQLARLTLLGEVKPDKGKISWVCWTCFIVQALREQTCPSPGMKTGIYNIICQRADDIKDSIFTLAIFNSNKSD